LIKKKETKVLKMKNYNKITHVCVRLMKLRWRQHF
jgi:hypothetical protein